MKKLKITLPQLLKVLETQKAKFPITIIMKGLDKEELAQLAKNLKDKS